MLPRRATPSRADLIYGRTTVTIASSLIPFSTSGSAPSTRGLE